MCERVSVVTSRITAIPCRRDGGSDYISGFPPYAFIDAASKSVQLSDRRAWLARRCAARCGMPTRARASQTISTTRRRWGCNMLLPPRLRCWLGFHIRDPWDVWRDGRMWRSRCAFCRCSMERRRRGWRRAKVR